jgi:DNA-damage-inducible protein J
MSKSMSSTVGSSVVRARIDEKTKEEAAAVLASIGLTVSDAFRLMMVRIAKEKALPFEPLIPNAKTIAAMRESRRGRKRYPDMKALLKDLNAGD